jgi:multisubunit Na+/H+ antiporter MnhF subunit
VVGELSMQSIFTYAIWFFVGSGVVSLIRVVIGPSTADRMIGLNMASAQVLAVLVLLAVREGQGAYLDVALVYDIFGFIGVLAMTRYFGGKKV